MKSSHVVITEQKVEIQIDPQTTISATLSIPHHSKAIVLFAHGSGSSRFSPRNRHVAEILQHKHLATILIDLLTTEEESVDMVTRHLRFDIPLLARRVVGATSWLQNSPETKHMKIGYFGASTGAAAALVAAAKLKDKVNAVVSRGGRPDLAQAILQKVTSPTLLIVGGNDSVVIDLNQTALEKLNCEKSLVIVPGAGHLFEQPGKLERVAEFAAQWFEEHLLHKKLMVGTKK